LNLKDKKYSQQQINFLKIKFTNSSAESEFNKSGIVQGQIDSNLTENGFEQARIAGERLKNTKFDFVYSSDLLRALNVSYQNCLKLI
jgi:bisphosphoglycerate-dependent phosphoglycerate mutase